MLCAAGFNLRWGETWLAINSLAGCFRRVSSMRLMLR
jgi:hypothetical protein